MEALQVFSFLIQSTIYHYGGRGLCTTWTRHQDQDAEPGTRQAYSAWACRLWQARMSTWRKPGSIQAYRVIHQPVFVVSQCSLMPGWWLASGDQRRLTGSGAHLRREATMRYRPTSRPLLYFTFTWTLFLPVYDVMWRLPWEKQEVKVIWQKAPHGGPFPRLDVTPGGRKLYRWIPGVGFPISVP